MFKVERWNGDIRLDIAVECHSFYQLVNELFEHLGKPGHKLVITRVESRGEEAGRNRTPDKRGRA
jgi:hypothetical protein